MNREDIIRMAREAGLHSVELLDLYEGNVTYSELDKLRRLERFAACIAAGEREACAKVCDEFASVHQTAHIPQMETAADLCAIAIRARGQA